MTRWFFDTEFIDTGRTIDLISIGIVREDGLVSYSACLLEGSVGFQGSGGWQEDNLEPWHREHVLPHLPPIVQRKPAPQVAKEILQLVEEDQPEFWAYFSSYDWVALCQLVTCGDRMIDLPISWPHFVCDLKLLMHLNHISKKDLPAQPEVEVRDALVDAQWIRNSYLYIMEHAQLAVST